MDNIKTFFDGILEEVKEEKGAELDTDLTAEDLMGIQPGQAFIHRNIANLVNNVDLSVMTVLNSYNKINSDDLQISNIILNASTTLILSFSSSMKLNEKIINNNLD